MSAPYAPSGSPLASQTSGKATAAIVLAVLAFFGFVYQTVIDTRPRVVVAPPKAVVVPRADRPAAGDVADRVIATREATWEDSSPDGGPARRTMGIANLGGATLDNEENYLIKKLCTALGIVQVENQARI